jgi:hypothetical protein
VYHPRPLSLVAVLVAALGNKWDWRGNLPNDSLQ